MQQLSEQQKLRQADSAAWSAEDAAGVAINAAHQAKRYMEMSSAQVSVLRTDIDFLAVVVDQQNQAIKRQDKLIARMELEAASHDTAQRNTCMVWGVVSALISSIAVGLIFAPNQAPVQRQVQGGIVNVR